MIRDFTENDIEAVMRLWLEGNLSAHDFISAEYWEKNYAPVRAAILSAQVLVYEHDGEVAGFIGLSGDYIAGIFVSEKFRSKGIGKALLDAAKKIHPVLWLHVYVQNAAAVSFYLREGFRITDETVDESTDEREFCMKFVSF